MHSEVRIEITQEGRAGYFRRAINVQKVVRTKVSLFICPKGTHPRHIKGLVGKTLNIG
jgi:hypothetical protein